MNSAGIRAATMTVAEIERFTRARVLVSPAETRRDTAVRPRELKTLFFFFFLVPTALVAQPSPSLLRFFFFFLLFSHRVSASGAHDRGTREVAVRFFPSFFSLFFFFFLFPLRGRSARFHDDPRPRANG